MGTPIRSSSKDWPGLPFSEWQETAAALHLWMQIVGKIRLVLTPWTNHSWHVPLYLTGRGLGTSLIPAGGRSFEMTFDLLGDRLVLEATDGGVRTIALEPGSVADFYRRVVNALAELGFAVRIYTTPSEIADGVPFERDTATRPYDREYAVRFWRILVQADRVLKEFRSRFIGKCSPVHFFWGSFDLAVTRFSGKDAPPHPGGIPNFPDWVAREAYSHEVSSAGFWPGTAGVADASFYSYAYPAPAGYASARVTPDDAYYATALGEYLLPYEAVRTASSPDDVLLEFLQSSYAAAADLAGWDRDELERVLPPSSVQAYETRS